MGPPCPTSPCCPAPPFTAPSASAPTSRAPSIPVCTSPPPVASTPGPSYSLCLPTLLHPPPVPSTPTPSHSHGPGSPCHLHGFTDPSVPFSSPPRSALSQGPSPASTVQEVPVVLRIPPPRGAPSVPAVSAAAAFSSLCTFLFPCGPFSGRNRTTAAPGRAGASKEGSKSETRRVKDLICRLPEGCFVFVSVLFCFKGCSSFH